MQNTLGSLIIDLNSLHISDEEKDLVKHPLVGGVILFSRNYESREQLATLCREIRSAKNKPILIMADQEGGRVQRFRDEFSPLPAFSNLGELYDRAPEDALKQTQIWGLIMAHELLNCGLDFSFSPVLDLNKGVSTVIGTRAFHAQVAPVVALASAFIEGMNQAGMAAVGKHFPGHGAIAADSHTDHAVDPRSIQEITADRQTFDQVIAKGIAGIMSSHIIFPVIDDLPVTYSSQWLRTILRQQLGFKGAIFSDDLTMHAASISENYAERVALAYQAGCDFTLVCNNRTGVIQALDNLAAKQYQVEPDKWGALSSKYRLSQSDLTS